MTTGRGELMSSICASFLAVEQMRAGASPEAAARYVLLRLREMFALDSEEDQCGIIALAADGTFSFASLKVGFRVVVTDGSRERVVEARQG